MGSDEYIISILRRRYSIYLGDNGCLNPRNGRYSMKVRNFASALILLQAKTRKFEILIPESDRHCLWVYGILDVKNTSKR